MFVTVERDGLEAAHAAHSRHSAAHAATAAGGHRGRLFGALGDERFGGQDQAGDGRRVLQGGPGDFDRVHDARATRSPNSPVAAL